MPAAAVGLLEGFHKHHIIPRHLGGDDSPKNLILLHPYDHAIAHYVRWKIYKTHGDAWAFNRLKAWLDDGGMTMRGMKHDEQAKQKISAESSSRLRKPHSDETKAKISAAKKGKPSNRKGQKHTKSTIDRMRQSHMGQRAWNKGVSGAVVWDEKSRQNLSESMKASWARKKEAAL